MTPIKAIRESLGALLAADTAWLATVTANKISLVMAAFTPSEDLVFADLTLATFDGSTALSAGTGEQQVGNDPLTNEQLVTIKEPAGGWRWETSGVTNLPQTIYGFALSDNTLATLLATALLDTPITLTEAGQEINLGTVRFTVVLEPLA